MVAAPSMARMCLMEQDFSRRRGGFGSHSSASADDGLRLAAGMSAARGVSEESATDCPFLGLGSFGILVGPAAKGLGRARRDGKEPGCLRWDFFVFIEILAATRA
jgi:hypothetical protein